MGSSISKLYKNNGATPMLSSNGGPVIGYGQGSCVGGSTFINAGYFSSTPEWVFEEWCKKNRTEIDFKTYKAYSDEIRSEISISKEKLTSRDKDSKKLLDGANKLNWKIERCERFLKNCNRNNMCPVGCPSESKQSMNVTYLKELIANGIDVFFNSEVIKIDVRNSKASSLLMINNNKKLIRVNFKNLFICGGPISTPHLVLKNRLADFKKNHNDFEFHINFRTVAKFKNEMIESNLSTVSIFFMREFEKEGALLSAANSDIPYLLATLSHFNNTLKKDVYNNFNNFALYIYQIKASSKGQVKSIFGNQYISYAFEKNDVKQIQKAILRISELFFMADAEYLLFPIQGSKKIKSMIDAKELADSFSVKDLHLISVHGMSSLRSGSENEQKTDYFGKLKNFENIFINDASIVPGNTGESPQSTVMSFVKHNVKNNVLL